jgi:hypothetical protein
MITISQIMDKNSVTHISTSLKFIRNWYNLQYPRPAQIPSRTNVIHVSPMQAGELLSRRASSRLSSSVPTKKLAHPNELHHQRCRWIIQESRILCKEFVQGGFWAWPLSSRRLAPLLSYSTFLKLLNMYTRGIVQDVIKSTRCTKTACSRPSKLETWTLRANRWHRGNFGLVGLSYLKMFRQEVSSRAGLDVPL